MATETNESSTDERDEEHTSNGSDESANNDLGTDEKSQEEMAAEFEERKQKQLRESRRRIGGFQVAATIVLVAIGLCCFYFGSIVGPTSHPLIEDALYLLGVLNLAAAVALQIRKNFSRTLVLVLMPLTIIGIILTFTNTSKSSLLVCLLCIAELIVMFRQPVLDEYDAPKE